MHENMKGECDDSGKWAPENGGKLRKWKEKINCKLPIFIIKFDRI